MVFSNRSFLTLFFFIFIFCRKGRREEGRKGGKEEGREGGRKEGREGEKGRKGGRERREGRKSGNERDIANLDLEVYKLISFFFLFLREGKKKKE